MDRSSHATRDRGSLPGERKHPAPLPGGRRVFFLIDPERYEDGIHADPRVGKLTDVAAGAGKCFQ